MTTTPELEACLRQLFQDHEHLADDAAPERLAVAATSRAKSDRRRRLVLALAAVVLLIGGVVIAQQVRSSQQDRGPALTAGLPSGALGDALRTFEASWAAAQPPKLTLLAPAAPDIQGTRSVETLEGGFSVGPDVLSTARPKDSVVQWDNLARATVPVMSAAETFESMQSYSVAEVDPCAGCAPNRVTGANLSTTNLWTPQGEAKAPVWEFSLEGSTSKVTMLAIPSSHLVQPAEWPDGIWGDFVMGVIASDDGRALTVSFRGEPIECPVTYSASTARSEHAVGVLIESKGKTCGGDQQASRHVTVQLNRPLGDAVVIDAHRGHPIFVVR